MAAWTKTIPSTAVRGLCGEMPTAIGMPSCTGNGDVAGPGAVISFVATATLICVLATLQFIADPENNFYPFLSKAIHDKLKEVIFGIDAAQLTTSCAIVAATISSYQNTVDYHAFLALGLAAMTSSSQVTTLLTLGHTKSIGSLAMSFRLILGLVQNSLVIWLYGKQVGIWPNELLDNFPYCELGIFGFCAWLSDLIRMCYLCCLILEYLFPKDPSRHEGPMSLWHAASWAVSRSRELIRHSKAATYFPWIGIAMAWATTCVSAGFVLFAKYGHEICNMHDPNVINVYDVFRINPDTDWSFGQFLAGAVVVAIPFSLAEAVLKGVEDQRRIQEGPANGLLEIEQLPLRLQSSLSVG